MYLVLQYLGKQMEWYRFIHVHTHTHTHTHKLSVSIHTLRCILKDCDSLQACDWTACGNGVEHCTPLYYHSPWSKTGDGLWH